MQRIVGVLALAVSLIVALPGVATASNDPFFPEQWGLEAIGAEAAWSQGRGAGMVIAVVDTGVDLDHEDLAGKLLTGRSFTGKSTPQDGNGHGTHVAGIAAASTGNGTGVAGVAPDASILPVQVLDENGAGNVNDVAEGIAWAAANGADVINLSFGEVSTDVALSPAFTNAIRSAWAKGVITVVAAGNDFVRTSSFTDEPALVVTATGRDDVRPRYASGVGSAQWGMAAPGGDGSEGQECETEDGIVSTYSKNGEDQYACLVGTSMAVPHVAGAAAVLRSMGLSPQQTVDQLLATSDDVGSSGRDTIFGAGRLNLARAVNVPPPATATTAAPTTTTETPAAVAAAPTSTAPPTTVPPTTTEPPTTSTTPSTISLPPTTANPVEPPSGRAIAILPGEGDDDSTRYALAVPAGLLVAGVGTAALRVRGKLDPTS
jgi:subtilisin family serine protease